MFLILLFNSAEMRKQFKQYARIYVILMSLFFPYINSIFHLIFLREKDSSCNKTIFVGPAEDYELPFMRDVPGDPDILQMREVVSLQRKRPMIHNQWSTREVCLLNLSNLSM